jgi:hypothetical protein
MPDWLLVLLQHFWLIGRLTDEVRVIDLLLLQSCLDKAYPRHMKHGGASYHTHIMRVKSSNH